MKKLILVFIVLGLAAEGVNLFMLNRDYSGNPGRDFGVIPGGYGRKDFGQGSLHSISYWVNMAFPAAAAIDFYEKKLAEKGWERENPAGTSAPKGWTTSVRQDPQSMVPDCGYVYESVWNHKTSGLTATLTLTYYDASPNKVCSPAPKNDELVVTVREWRTAPAP